MKFEPKYQLGEVVKYHDMQNDAKGVGSVTQITSQLNEDGNPYCEYCVTGCVYSLDETFITGVYELKEARK